MGSAPTFTIPPTISRLLDRPVALAWARKDAALVARIYRAMPLDGVREESEERFARNRLARGNARQFVRLWKARNES